MVPRGVGGAMVPSGSSLPVDTPMQYRSVCGRCGARRVDQQLGLEATPAEYLARMVAVFREVRRVLRSDGTCWVNMGDGYTSGTRTTQAEPGGIVGQPGMRNGMQRRVPVIDSLKPKDLIGMPWRLAFALQADGWWLRSEIIWAKPNPMPESVTDRPTKAHEQIFLLTKAARYFYNADAIREAHARLWDSATNGGSFAHPTGEHMKHGSGWSHTGPYPEPNPAGRNARSVWTIATQAFPEAHFATFPEELPRRCILAGTSERGVCPACGAPWRRVVERTVVYPERRGGLGLNRDRNDGGMAVNADRTITTTGWDPECSHAAEPVPAVVLDPFAGSGTTLMVAVRHGRSALGIELNPEYAEMARRRILADHGAYEPPPQANGHTPAEARGVQGRLNL